MRAIWKGAVSFGLVSVPVKLYAATESKDVSFRQVHAADGGRIRYQRVCSKCGQTVEYSDIAKGYETEDGEMVVLTDEDLAELPASSSREISVDKFVPSEQVDPMLMEKSYYLEPDQKAGKPYALLREALQDSDRMALVTVSLRQRMSLAVLRVREDVIVLQTLMWPDEIRQPDFSIPGTEDAKPAEVKMATMLVETLAGDFDADEYDDDYREAVAALVQRKIEGGEIQQAPTREKSSGEVVDLLAALQRSVDAAKASRGESGAKPSEQAVDEDAEADEDTGTEEAGGTKKSAAKKSAAKKSAAKRSAGKKAADKKSAAKKSGTKKTAAKKDTKKSA